VHFFEKPIMEVHSGNPVNSGSDKNRYTVAVRVCLRRRLSMSAAV
jgi:hypothetical protein